MPSEEAYGSRKRSRFEKYQFGLVNIEEQNAVSANNPLNVKHSSSRVIYLALGGNCGIANELGRVD